MVAGKANVEVEQIELKGAAESARRHATAGRYILDAKELSYFTAKDCVCRP